MIQAGAEQEDDGTASCLLGPIPAGSQTQVDLVVVLKELAGCGVPVRFTVTSGGLSTSAESARTVQYDVP